LVVTHAAKLIATLEKQKECNSVRLEKEFGETKIVGADRLDLPVWRWAAR
jgi:predicted ATPase